MDIWKVLGIEKTDDEEAIKAAYLEQLSLHHPEEDPEGFMQLRKAFEEAFRQLNHPEEEEEETDPEIKPWMDRMKEVYEDYRRRVNPKEWVGLLNDPLCIGLETAEMVNHGLLTYLMNNNYIPHVVWKLMAEHMGWFESRSALCQSFPENFIDYVLNQASYPDFFRYDGFDMTEDRDYDTFVRCFFGLSRAVRDRQTEEAAALMNRMLDMELEHPDFDILQVRYYLYLKCDPAAAWNLAQKIKCGFQEPVEDREIYWYVCAGLAAGKEEGLKPYVERLLLLDGDNASSVKLAGDYYAAIGEVQTALLYYDRAAGMDRDNDAGLDESRDRMYELLSHRLEAELEMNPTENLKWKAGRACYFGSRYDRAREILESVKEAGGREDRLYWWLADSCFALEDYQAAESYCDKVLERDPISSDALPLKVRLLAMREANGEMIRLVEPALEKGYRSVPVIFNYARALRRTEQYEKAGEYLGMLEEQIGRNPSVMMEFARLRHAMQQYEEALDYTGIVLEQQPDSDEAILFRAQILVDMKRYQEALDIYLGQEAKGKADSYIFYRIGNTYACMKNSEKAEEYYKKALELNPGYSAALNELGDVYQKLGRWEEAVEAYRKAVEGGRGTARRLWDLVRLLKRMRRWEEALSYAVQGMKEYPKDYRFFYNGGKCASGLDRYEEAIKYFEIYGELDDRCDALICIGNCYIDQKQFEKAEEYFWKCTEEFPEKDAGWNALGRINLEYLENYEKALEYYTKAYERKADNTYRLICMGRCYTSLGETEKAREKFLESLKVAEGRIEKNPSSPCSYESAAEAYSYLGDVDMAVKMAEKAIEHRLENFGCPRCNCYEAYQDMGRAWENAGDLEKALECYQDAWEWGQSDDDLEIIERLKKALGKEA